ncbi:MAG: acetyl-CoA carboxylase, carboxyltransferase subunit beta [Gemmatimonadota bacterium]
MAWFRKRKNKPATPAERREIPSDVWIKCEGCGEIIFKKELARNLWVCGKCRYHFRISCTDYIELLTDPGTFRETDAGLLPVDPLEFVDRKPYVARLDEYRRRTGRNEAVVSGDAEIGRVPVSLAVMDFSFIGGSMGSVVGEKVARTVERGLSGDRAVVVVSASGGARMMEGILSLMQMAKTAALLAVLHERAIPFVSVLTDPTTGGVTASYASLGDVVLAEPGARIGFAGPRVIKQTIGQDLPEGFQTSEFLLDHGLLDAVVDRGELRETVARVLRHLRRLPALAAEE